MGTFGSTDSCVVVLTLRSADLQVSLVCHQPEASLMTMVKSCFLHCNATAKGEDER